MSFVSSTSLNSSTVFANALASQKNTNDQNEQSTAPLPKAVQLCQEWTKVATPAIRRMVPYQNVGSTKEFDA